MRKLFVFLFLLFTFSLHSQPGMWTWMHGSNVINSTGNFGTQLIPSPSNDPPALTESAHWTDLQGNFWVFGGKDPNGNYFSAMWKFDPQTAVWTWMHGPSTINSNGNFGTQNIASPSNDPSARWSAATWTDNNGNLWMFGGEGYAANGNPGRLADMWMFNPVTNMWTWMHGPSTSNAAGSYGVQLVAAASNLPPARCFASGTWTDNNNNLYLFSGTTAGYYNGASLSDIWRYSVTTNMWTWMRGISMNMYGVYGTKGVFAPANEPGARIAVNTWEDNAGRFWMQGGFTNGTDSYNDLWIYDPVLNQWAWMSGLNYINGSEVFNQMCESDSLNQTGQTFHQFHWTDQLGNFWMYGHGNYGSTIALVWYYNVSIGEWAVVGGVYASNYAGSYGTMNVPAASNFPPSRNLGCSFRDLNGNFWLFGGTSNSSTDLYNDIWVYTPDFSSNSNCPPTMAPLTSAFTGNMNGCAPYTVTFSNNSFNASSYFWDFGNSQTSNQANPTTTYSSPGTYTVMLIASDSIGSDTSYATINVYAMPVAAVSGTDSVCAGANAIVNASGGAAYNWNTGDTTAQITVNPTASTTYSVVVSNFICNDTGYYTVNVLPLPLAAVSGTQTICIGQSATLTATGGTIYSWSSGQTSASIAVNPNTSTNYTVTVSDGTCSDTAQVFVNVLAYPVPDITGDTILCPGASAVLTATGGNSYSWSNGQTSASIIVAPVSDTLFSVSVSNGYCASTDSISLHLLPLPIVNAVADDTILIGTSTVLSVSSGLSYLWTPSNGLDCSNCQSPNANPGTTTTYIVYVTDAQGCVGSDTVTVYVDADCGQVFIANAFSPNGDGQNDLLYVRGKCIESMSLSIYDRWGTAVFQSDDISKCWDGTYRGQKLENAVFMYYLSVTLTTGEKINKQGNISIIR